MKFLPVSVLSPGKVKRAPALPQKRWQALVYGLVLLACSVFTYPALAVPGVTVLTNLTATRNSSNVFQIGNENLNSGPNLYTPMACQSFVVGATDLILTGVTLYLDATTGTPNQPMVVSIYSNTTASGYFNGSNTASQINQPGTLVGTLTAVTSTNPTTAGQYSYSSTGLALSAGVTYWIVASTTSSNATGGGTANGFTGNFYNWYYDGSSSNPTAQSGWSVPNTGSSFTEGIYHGNSGFTPPDLGWNIFPQFPQLFSITATASVVAPAITSAPSDGFATGVSNSFTVTAKGLPAPTLSLSGTLPSGVTFNSSTGVLSGTPAAGTAGSYSVTITASNGVGTAASQSFTLIVANPVNFANGMAAIIEEGEPSLTTAVETASQSGLTLGDFTYNVALSSTGKMAVADPSANRVLIWNTIPTSNGQNADVVVGQTNFTNTGSGTSQTQLNGPCGVTFSPDGTRLIVADQYNSRVLIWNTVPTTNGAPADMVLGQSDFVTSTPGPLATGISRPSAVAVSPDGKLLVSDYAYGRVAVYNTIPTVSGILPDVVVGQTSFSTQSSTTSQTGMRDPSGLCVSPSGVLFVADSINHRVLVYNSIPTTNGAAADVVLGQTTFTGNSSSAGASGFLYPNSISVSPSGQVAVADSNHYRVLIFNSIPTANGASANFVLGQPDFATTNGFSAVNATSFYPYGVQFGSDGRLWVFDSDAARTLGFGSLSVTGVSPTGGPVAGGTTVTIAGVGFTGASSVQFGSTAAASFTVNSDTRITATSPAGTGTVDITVTTPDGTSNATSADQFTYAVPLPIITGISPAYGPAGGGNTVTIAGSGFTGATAVSFGGTAAASFTVNSDGSITAVVPSGLSGIVNVTVTAAGGTSAVVSEDRFTELPTFTVTNTNDTGTGSLRAAFASAGPSGGIVVFSNGTSGGATNFYDGTSHTITFGSVIQFNTSSTVVIQGPGANVLSLSGNNSVPIFAQNDGTFYLSGVTLTQGAPDNDLFTGAISSAGTFHLANCAITACLAGNSGGTVTSTGTSSVLTMDDCTLSGNSGANAGGIFSIGTLRMSNCTLTGNNCQFGAGGLQATGSLQLNNCTIANNSSSNSDGGIGFASGVSGSVTNCIVSGNTGGLGSAPDIADSLGRLNVSFSLVGSNSGNTVTNGTNGNLVGANPQLGALGYNGGTTQTMALQTGSAALNVGSNALAVDTSGNPLTTDQRGFVRVLGTTVDMGAVEGLTYTVTNTNDSGTGSLRAAVASAASTGGEVIFSNNTTSGATNFFDGTQHAITLTSAVIDFTTTSTVGIQGPGAKVLSVSGGNTLAILQIDGGALSLSGVTLTQGKTSNNGGAIRGGTGVNLHLSYCAITSSACTGNGGGIDNEQPGATTTLDNCTLSGNNAGSNGGALCAACPFKLSNCTLTSNSASSSGAICPVGSLSYLLSNCTLSGNSAGTAGGAISNSGSAGNLVNCIVAGNTASVLGADIFAGPAPGVSATNSLIGNRSNTSFNDGVNGNRVGTSAAPLDPGLSPLANNGGPTQTMALLSTSPAINAGSNSLALDTSGNALTTDQRGPGFPRLIGSAVDMGAVESTPSAPLPVITGVSPNNTPTAAGIVNVAITGSGFTGVTAVKFGSVSASFTFNSDSSITAIAPAEFAGTVDITVTTSAGTSAIVPADQFTYVGAAFVTSLSPAFGPSAGGTSVTIMGGNFIAGNTSVTIGGATVPVGSVTVNSPTSLTFSTPAQTAGNVTVTVTNQFGTSSAVSGGFTYEAAPTATSLLPTSGPTAGGIPVTITGTNFTAGDTSVTIGGTTIPAGSVTVNSPTSLTFSAPAHATGTVTVTVSTSGGTSSPVLGGFNYSNSAVVISVSPNSGPLAGSTSVTIAGSGFTAAMAVNFGGTAATNFTVVSDTQITATSPAGSAGTVDVTVVTPGGTSATSSADQFTYLVTLQSIDVTPHNPSVAQGGSQQFTATGTYSDSSAADITSTVTWSSDTTSHATINSSGLATAVGVGSSNISATLGAVTGSTTLTVTASTTLQFAVGSETVNASDGSFSVQVNLSGTAPTNTATSTYATGFSTPNGLAFDSHGNLYVSNLGSTTVSKVTAQGATPTSFATGLSAPRGLAFDSLGFLYVANSSPGTVIKVPPTGGTGTTFASGITGVVGLAFDSSGNLYASSPSANQVFRVTPMGVKTTYVGAGLSTPRGLAFDRSGNLYIANNGSATIGIVPPGTAPVGGFTATTFVTLATAPFQMTIDASGNLYVAASTSVYKVTPQKVVTTFASGLTSGASIAFDTKGNFYVDNSGNVSILSAAISVPYTLGGTAVSGTDYSGLANGSLPFAVGQTSATITGNLLVDPGANPTLTFTLGTPTGTAVLGSPSVNTMTITNPPIPVVASVSPITGSTSGNTTVTITGSHFTGVTGVTFGSAAASFTFNSDSSITAVSPAGSGTVDVTVTTAGGPSATSAADQFTYITPPVAVNDGVGTYATGVNRQFGRGASPDGVLSNDTLNGATITSYGATTGAEQTSIGSATATAQGGSITLRADGSFTYTPATNFSGNDTFKYTLTNGGGSSTALVTIYVDVLPTVTSTTPASNATLVSINTPITINFSEPINTTAAFTVTDTTTSTGVAFNQSPTDGNATSTFTLTPTPQLVGGHVYTVTAIGNQTADVDGGQSMAGNYVFSFTTLPIPVPVNDPDAQGGTYQVTTGVTFDSALLTPSSSVFDNDALFGATVTYGPSGPAASTLVDGTTTVSSFMGGTVLMRTNGTFTYTPAAGFTGTDRFFYKLTNASVDTVHNGTPQAQAILTVNVNNVPTLNAISSPPTIPVNSPIQSVSLSGITDGVGDTGQTLTVSATSDNQTLIPNGNISVTYTSPNAVGTVKYTPAANQFGTAVIAVAVKDNGGTASGGVDTVVQTFTVIVNPPAPSVTLISPTAGPAAGGTVLTLTGTNFTGATAVKFGVANATTFTVNSATSITATSPAGSAGTVDVTVTTPNGTSATSAADQFSYVLAPVLSGVSPSSGRTAGGTTVTITGSNFLNATAVNFGSTPATTFTVTNSSTISATSPAGTGTVNVTVTTAGGTSGGGTVSHFTYVPPPTISSISPVTGSTAGGTTVAITGTNFTGLTAVKFGSTTAGFSFISDTSIRAFAPAGTAGTVDITVTTNFGASSTSAADQFTYAQTPSITSISPTAGPIAGSTVLTLTGTNFTGATAVKFGVANATTFTVNSATSITATSPAGTGTVDITVTTPNGTSTTGPADQFTYVPPPAVTGLSPTSGPTAGSTSVIITGSNFSGATQVKFGVTNATGFLVNSPSQITATAPSGTGTVDVTVTTSGGTSATSTVDQFTYAPVPTVHDIFPNSGTTGGGTPVVISGTGFLGATAVSIGGAAVTSFNVTDDTGIVTTTPAHALGANLNVSVTTPGGTNTPNTLYSYTNPTGTGSIFHNGPDPQNHMRQGGTGTVTFNVMNNGPGATGGTLTVTATLPAGLTPGTLPTGAPWNCTAIGQTLTCTNTNVAAESTSFNPLVIPVNVASNAATSVTVSGATFSGAGMTAGTFSSDTITIDPAPILSISKTHSGSFTQGSTASWNLVVSNNSGTASGSTDGSTVTVTDTLPAGYTVQSIVPSAQWNFSGSTTTQVIGTSTAVVAGSGGSFTTITVNVNVPANSPTSVTNTAQVFGGGDLNHNNSGNAASGTDTVSVVQVPASISLTSGNNQSQLVSTAFPAPFSATVLDANSVPIGGTSVAFTAPVSGASGTFSASGTRSTSVTTNGSGVATASTYTANSTAGGPYNVVVSAGTITNNFSVTNLSATPTITTTQQPASAAVGSSIADKATVSGGSNPTGTVTFKLYNNSTGTGTPLFTDANEPLSSGAATSSGYTTTATGTVYWVATYNGDSNNNSVTSATAGEPVSVNKASPTISTTQQPFTATFGTSIADQATVNGGASPTGTVTFNLYNNQGANGSPLFTDTETLVSGKATSASFTPSAVGTYYWVDTYNGDSNNNGVTSGTAAEPVSITAAASTVAVNSISNVTYSPSTQNIPLSATVSGPPAVNEGTVTFAVFGSGNVQIGAAVTTPTVSSGNASTNFTLPSGQAPGTYSVSATYNPGADFTGSTSTTPQTFTVAKAGPTLASTASVSLILSPGSKTLTDSAVLSGGSNETGTMTFVLKLGGATVDTETTTVTGNGTYSTPTGYTLPTTGTVTGTYTWSASYSGDTNNSSSTDQGGSTEQTVVSAATPTIGTTQQPASATVGTSIADHATLSGGYNMTGTVTFKLYNNPAGSGTPLFTDTEALVGGTATSVGYTTTATGTDYWVAIYSGDGNNNSVTSSASGEPVTINAATPSIATTQQPASVIVGASIADKATISGGDNPTGTVTFNLYNNPNGTGTPLFTDANEPLSGGSATSKGYSTAATGTVYWMVTYNGDSVNNAVTSSTSGEPVSITLASPTIATIAQPTSATVGSPIASQATISGGYIPSGTVTFNLYNNQTASGTPLFTDTEALSKGTATSKGFTTTANGTDYWVATYNGDTNNNAVTSGAASSPVLVGTVNPTASALTTSATLNRQTGLSQLTVNVTNTTAGALNGFRLHVNYNSYLTSFPTLRLYNASSAPGASDVFVNYPYPVTVGATIAVNLEFYTVNRVMPNPFAPILTVESLMSSETPVINETGTPVSNITRLADKTVLLQWSSVAGNWYRVSYSSDMVHWYDSPTPIQAGSNAMQWIDSGPPFTSISPADPSVTSRFYIVNQIPTP